jgi:putative ABC transport system permease protein
MLKLSRIALKNVFRNRRRTLITFSVIIFGSSALLVAGGFIRYLVDGLATVTIRGGLGHLQLINPDQLRHDEEKPLQYGLVDAERIAAVTRGIEGVRGATARIDFMGLLSNGDKSVIFLGTGVEPEKERDLGYETEIVSGSSLTSKEGNCQVMLATGLAKSLNSKVGDTLTLMSTTTEGAFNAIDAEVAGIFSTGISEYDDRALRVPLSVSQRLLDTGKVSKLVIGLQETADTDRLHDVLGSRLQSAGYELEIRRWYEMADFYRAVVRLFNAIFTMLGTIIFVLVVLSSSNTMLMAVMERVREIGTLMAFGTSRLIVLGIFVIEGILVGVLGGGFGAVFGFFVIKVINGAHLTLPTMPGNTHGFPIQIPLIPGVFIGVFFLMVAMMIVASFLPAMRASRLKIVDALNHI